MLALFGLILFAMPLIVPLAVAVTREPGATEVLRWKGGRLAAMSVTLDDQLDSQRKFAVPELEKRHLKATFFINPGNDRFTEGAKTFWQVDLPKLGHEYGVHTMQHRATDETVEIDLAKCVEILRKVNPNSSPLMSFATPGGKDPSGVPVWNVSKEKGAAALAKNNLVSRDTQVRMYLPGATLDSLQKWVDQVIASGGFEKICFHGVGGDYITVPADVFTGYLDYLVAKQDKLWVAPHITVHKYAREFETAKASGKVVGDQIEVRLTCAVDPVLYDEPLTLQTQVPTDWGNCKIVQGKTTVTAKVADGVVRYDAHPGLEAVILSKAKAEDPR